MGDSVDLIVSLKSQGKQGARISSFKKPACAHAQTVMPGWEPGSVHRKPGLSSDWSAKRLTTCENGRPFRSQAHRLTQLLEVLGLKFVAIDECSDVASGQA